MINVQICLFAKSRITIQTGFFSPLVGMGLSAGCQPARWIHWGREVGGGRSRRRRRRRRGGTCATQLHKAGRMSSMCATLPHTLCCNSKVSHSLARSLSRCWVEPGFHLTGEEALQHTWSVGRDDCRTAPQGGTNHRTGGRLLLSWHEKKDCGATEHAISFFRKREGGTTQRFI